MSNKKYSNANNKQHSYHKLVRWVVGLRYQLFEGIFLLIGVDCTKNRWTCPGVVIVHMACGDFAFINRCWTCNDLKISFQIEILSSFCRSLPIELSHEITNMIILFFVVSPSESLLINQINSVDVCHQVRQLAWRKYSRIGLQIHSREMFLSKDNWSSICTPRYSILETWVSLELLSV